MQEQLNAAIAQQIGMQIIESHALKLNLQAAQARIAELERQLAALQPKPAEP